MADFVAAIDDIPEPRGRRPQEPRITNSKTHVPATDFPRFRTAMLADRELYGCGLAAYDDELDRSGVTLTTCPDPSSQLTTAVVNVVRAAPDDGELIARLRAL